MTQTETVSGSGIRANQAQRLFDLGFGGDLELEDYLRSIPDIPKHMLGDDTEFPFLVLVDQRLGLTKTCKLANIYFGGNDNTFVPRDKKYVEPEEPYWIRIQDGRKNHNVSPKDCRKRFKKNECGLTAIQGVASFIQHPDIIKQGEHAMDLPGSVHSDLRDGIAYLEVWCGKPRLYWNCDDDADPRYGSGSRREYNL